MRKRAKKPRWHLFGMCGTWNEYHYFHRTKLAAHKEGSHITKAGYDAWIEDTKTGRVWRLVPK